MSGGTDKTYDIRVIEDRIQEFKEAALEERRRGRALDKAGAGAIPKETFKAYQNRGVYEDGVRLLKDISRIFDTLNLLESRAGSKPFGEQSSDRYLEVKDAIVDTILDVLNS